MLYINFSKSSIAQDIDKIVRTLELDSYKTSNNSQNVVRFYK